MFGVCQKWEFSCNRIRYFDDLEIVNNFGYLGACKENEGGLKFALETPENKWRYYVKRRWALILLSFIVLASCGRKLEPEEGCNFVQNSQLQRVSWKGQFPIEIYIHESVPEAYFAAIKGAMAQWEYKLNRPVFKLVGVTGGDNDGGQKDGRSVIYYMNNWELDQAREQARTTIYWVGDVINEADMRLNASNFSFFSGDMPESNKVDMESLIVHELGHVLGLQHNDVVPSVMATTLASATFRRSPKPADVASLQCEYN